MPSAPGSPGFPRSPCLPTLSRPLAGAARGVLPTALASMDRLTRDLRHAVRSLLRTRGLSAVAILCMGLGIGVCATLFATANPWLFRPLPYAQAERLMALRETPPRQGLSARRGEPLSGPNYLDWMARSRSFEALGAFERTELNLSTEDEPERVQAARITATLFPSSGKEAVLGRGLRPGGGPAPEGSRWRCWATASGGAISVAIPGRSGGP